MKTSRLLTKLKDTGALTEDELKEIVERMLRAAESIATTQGHTLGSWKYDLGARTVSNYCTRCRDCIYYYYEPNGKFSTATDEVLRQRCR